MKFLRNQCCIVALAAAAAFLPGCGKAPTSARVVGAVTAAGKPVTGGMVRFYSEDGRSVGGQIDSTGRYSVADAPLGENRVTVTTSHLKASRKPDRFAEMSKPPEDALPDPQAAAVYVEIDPAYESLETTKLSVTVTSGENTIDLSLE
jgi:hypothetical protein